MKILFMMLICCAMAQSSVVVLLTPSPYLDLREANSSNVSFITTLGMRQSYLIGRELLKNYSDNSDYSIKIFSDNSNPSTQTAQGVARGYYLHGIGQLVKNKKLQEHGVPPIPSFNFSDFNLEMRDQSLPYYMKGHPIHSLKYNNDLFFHAESICVAIKKVIDKNLVDCQATNTSKEACGKFEKFCKFPIKRGQDACECFGVYERAEWHKKVEPIDKNLVQFMKKTCKDYQKKLLAETGEVAVAKLMSEKLLDDLNGDLDKAYKMTVYVISELQMKAVVYTLTSRFPDKNIKYGSMLTIQRDFKEDDSSYIKVALNSEYLSINGKEELEYKVFNNLIKGMKLSNYNMICNEEVITTTSKSNLKLILIIIGAIIGAILILIGLFFLIRKLKNRIPEESHEENHEENRRFSVRKAMQNSSKQPKQNKEIPAGLRINDSGLEINNSFDGEHNEAHKRLMGHN